MLETARSWWLLLAFELELDPELELEQKLQLELSQ